MHPFPRMRWAAAAWLFVWAPAYAWVWGFANFLHLCDIAVILTCAGLWSGSALLLSSQALFSIGADLLWDLDVCSRIVSGKHLFGGTEYMWQPEFPLAVRLLSLFHVVWPLLLVWSLCRVGYDRRGLPLQAAITLAALIASRAFGPALNLNYVFRDPLWGRQFGPAVLHVTVIFGATVGLVYVPAHALLSRLLRGRFCPPRAPAER
jgi:hypothetical protein